MYNKNIVTEIRARLAAKEREQDIITAIAGRGEIGYREVSDIIFKIIVEKARRTEKAEVI